MRTRTASRRLPESPVRGEGEDRGPTSAVPTSGTRAEMQHRRQLCPRRVGCGGLGKVIGLHYLFGQPAGVHQSASGVDLRPGCDGLPCRRHNQLAGARPTRLASRRWCRIEGFDGGIGVAMVHARAGRLATDCDKFGDEVWSGASDMSARTSSRMGASHHSVRTQCARFSGAGPGVALMGWELDREAHPEPVVRPGLVGGPGGPPVALLLRPGSRQPPVAPWCPTLMGWCLVQSCTHPATPLRHLFEGAPSDQVRLLFDSIGTSRSVSEYLTAAPRLGADGDLDSAQASRKAGPVADEVGPLGAELRRASAQPSGTLVPRFMLTLVPLYEFREEGLKIAYERVEPLDGDGSVRGNARYNTITERRCGSHVHRNS